MKIMVAQVKQNPTVITNYYCTLWLLIALLSNNYVHCEMTGFTDPFDVPEDPSPYGENVGIYPRDKSIDCTCGLSSLKVDNSSNSRIETISPSAVPWLVFIYVMFDSTGHLITPTKICSGTIINDRVILTTASCLVSVPTTYEEEWKIIFRQTVEPDPENILVLMANGEEINLKDNSTFTRLEVEHITFNPYYLYHHILYNKHDWDIAFIQLRQPLAFNDDTGFVPVCLPMRYLANSKLEGVPMITFGWNRFSLHDPDTAVRKAMVHSLKLHITSYIHPMRICQVVTVRDWISDKFFCTDGPEFLAIKFIESHGSPMLFQTSTNPPVFIQYGIVSWDLVGILVKKRNIRVSSNLSGFLQVVEDFSDSVDAKWCFNGAPRSALPTPDPDWNGGMELIERVGLDTISHSELSRVTSGHRQYYPSSVCKCGDPTGEGDKGTVRYNWNVRLVQAEFGQEGICGGSIINDRIILTTASCLNSMLDKFYGKGLFGSGGEIIHHPKNLKVQLNFMIPKINSNTLNVSMVIPHLEHKKSLHDSSDNDMALIVLENTMAFPELNLTEVSPICLPDYDFKPISSEEARGVFLLPSKDGSPRVSVTILDKRLCKLAWKKIAEEMKDPLGMVPKNVEEMFDFTTRFCGAIKEQEFKAYVQDAHGLPVVIPIIKGNDPPILTQVGIFSQMTNSILKPIVGSKLDHNQGFMGMHLEDKIIVAFNEILPCRRFIDYFSLVVDAKWCPPSQATRIY